MPRLTLLDQAAVRRSDGPVVKAEAYAAVVEARRLVDDARAHAEALRAGVADEIALARERGYREGTAAAAEAFAQRTTDQAMRMEASYIGLEARVVNTVMQALKTVLGALDEKLLLDRLVRQAVQAAGQEKRMFLRVAEGQFERVNDIVTGLLADYPHIEFIDVVKDPAIAFWDCVLETEYGAVDGGLEQHLNMIRHSLVTAFAGKRVQARSGEPA